MIEQLNKLVEIIESLKKKEHETEDMDEKDMLENLRKKLEDVISKYGW
jgi:hypothetical protein